MHPASSLPKVLLLISCLLLLLTRASAQDGTGLPVDAAAQPADLPNTPEQPESDVHFGEPPEPHPDIVDALPPPAPRPDFVEGQIDPPPQQFEADVLSGESSNADPDSVLAPPNPDVAPGAVMEGMPTAPDAVVPVDALAEDPAPLPPPPPPRIEGPFNPWQVPSPGQPTIEMQAGSSFKFSWIANTEGVVSLELWQIEDNAPVPKFLLASEIKNMGLWLWKIHRNFPHGTGYCLVIVPPDRNHASLSPLFDILGDTDYDMPVPVPTDHVLTLNDLEVSHEGTQRKLYIAVGLGLIACNVVAAAAWLINDREGSRHDSPAFYSTLQKDSGKRVFHARTPSTKIVY